MRNSNLLAGTLYRLSEISERLIGKGRGVEANELVCAAVCGGPGAVVGKPGNVAIGGRCDHSARGCSAPLHGSVSPRAPVP
jgi:hypothetical protein